jgi:hypothetical protein
VGVRNFNVGPASKQAQRLPGTFEPEAGSMCQRQIYALATPSMVS